MQKKNPPRAARGDDDRLGSDQHEIPSRNFDRHNALAAAFIDNQIDAEKLIETPY